MKPRSLKISRRVRRAKLGMGRLGIALFAIALVLGPAPTTLLAATNSAVGGGSRIEEFLTTLGELIVGGGVLMIPIALASILTLGLAIERLWALQRRRILPREVWRDVKTELEGGNLAGARRRADENRTALGRMLASGLERWEDGTKELTHELEEAGQREADDLNTHLPALQGIASVAPLLGLLGTVVGMIKSFYTIAKEHAVGNPELFAGPIGQALVTTAAGLSVAIPAMILYYWFRGRIRKIVRNLDDIAREVVKISRRGTFSPLGAGSPVGVDALRERGPSAGPHPFGLATEAGN